MATDAQIQPSLFDNPVRRKFHGPDVEKRDAQRLESLLGRVEKVMSSGEWLTLAQIALRSNGMEASVSARLRDLRHDGYTIDRKKTETPGIFLYRMTK